LFELSQPAGFGTSVAVALSAAEISLKYTLPMADAVVYATAVKEACPVVTSNAHFKELDDVIYLEV